jgi:hypothetical protein
MRFSWVVIKDMFSWVKNLALRPRLKLYFDPDQTYHVARDLAFGRLNGMFVHVMLINRGRIEAKKCTALLAEVHGETSPGAYRAMPLFNNPVELHWAHEPVECFTKDIPPNEPTRLDVCYAHEGRPELHFFCEKRPRGVQTDFPPGRYKIKIQVRSEDGITCSRRFLVAYDGNFRNLYMEELEA